MGPLSPMRCFCRRAGRRRATREGFGQGAARCGAAGAAPTLVWPARNWRSRCEAPALLQRQHCHRLSQAAVAQAPAQLAAGVGGALPLPQLRHTMHPPGLTELARLTNPPTNRPTHQHGVQVLPAHKAVGPRVHLLANVLLVPHHRHLGRLEDLLHRHRNLRPDACGPAGVPKASGVFCRLGGDPGAAPRARRLPAERGRAGPACDSLPAGGARAQAPFMPFPDQPSACLLTIAGEERGGHGGLRAESPHGRPARPLPEQRRSSGHGAPHCAPQASLGPIKLRQPSPCDPRLGVWGPGSAAEQGSRLEAGVEWAGRTALWIGQRCVRSQSLALTLGAAGTTWTTNQLWISGPLPPPP